jgi:hypothetical protein
VLLKTYENFIGNVRNKTAYGDTAEGKSETWVLFSVQIWGSCG